MRSKGPAEQKEAREDRRACKKRGPASRDKASAKRTRKRESKRAARRCVGRRAAQEDERESWSVGPGV